MRPLSLFVIILSNGFHCQLSVETTKFMLSVFSLMISKILQNLLDRMSHDLTLGESNMDHNTLPRKPAPHQAWLSVFLPLTPVGNDRVSPDWTGLPCCHVQAAPRAPASPLHCHLSLLSFSHLGRRRSSKRTRHHQMGLL